MNIVVSIISLVALATAVIVNVRLNKKIDALDDALFQYMKDECNSKVAEHAETNEMPEYAEWKDAYDKMTDCSWK